MFHPRICQPSVCPGPVSAAAFCDLRLARAENIAELKPLNLHHAGAMLKKGQAKLAAMGYFEGLSGQIVLVVIVSVAGVFCFFSWA